MTPILRFSSQRSPFYAFAVAIILRQLVCARAPRESSNGTFPPAKRFCHRHGLCQAASSHVEEGSGRSAGACASRYYFIDIAACAACMRSVICLDSHGVRAEVVRAKTNVR